MVLRYNHKKSYTNKLKDQLSWKNGIRKKRKNENFLKNFLKVKVKFINIPYIYPVRFNFEG